jgi:2-oxoglutarate dehydrogenase E2 component (dihydrolipoamide succinyltransferase)
MGFTEIRIPAMGEGIIEATIIRWLVKEGDTVEPDTPLVEIATDKVDTEITANHTGTIKKILRREGDIPKVGETVALVLPEGMPETEDYEIHAKPSYANSQDYPEISLEYPVHEEDEQPWVNTSDQVAGTSQPYLSPFIRKAAMEMGLSIEELARVKGTAVGQRISKKDFYRYLDLKLSGMDSNMEKNSILPERLDLIEKKTGPDYQGAHEIVKMDRMRKLIADHMVHSKHTAPHVTSFYEADLSLLTQWRNEHKTEFQEKYKEKLTLTPFFVEAVAKALKKYPRINVSLNGDNILVKKDINIGIATALPDGNLIVPVIRNADLLNLEGLAIKVNDLSIRARESRLQPSEITGGTFTITNLGMFQSVTGTPVINQPESAIIAVGAILRKPAIVQGPFGESIGIRDICMLALSYDHRIIDGSLGGLFLREVAKNLENADINRMI